MKPGPIERRKISVGRWFGSFSLSVLLKRSLTLNPSADTYYKLAKLQNDSGLHRDALESIRVAISLRGDNPDYYKERESYYKERERTEEGLTVDETDRKRHLAAGYMEIGDSMLKQLKTYQAFAAYKASERVLLSELARLGKNAELGVEPSAETRKRYQTAVSADLAVISSKLSHVREVSRTTTVLELASGRILSMQEGEGLRRQVIIDRGSSDGLVARSEGVVWSVYSNVENKERKVQKTGTARIVAVEPQTATVEVAIDNPTGDGMIRVGDIVEVRAKVPVLLLAERSIFWRLAKYHIDFLSEDGKRIPGDYRSLYLDEKEELVEQVLDALVSDVKKTAEMLATHGLMSRKLTEGRFKDKTLRQAMDNPTRADVLDFLKYIMKFPAIHYGKDVKFGRAWGTWVLQGTPQ